MTWDVRVIGMKTHRGGRRAVLGDWQLKGGGGGGGVMVVWWWCGGGGGGGSGTVGDPSSKSGRRDSPPQGLHLGAKWVQRCRL